MGGSSAAKSGCRTTAMGVESSKAADSQSTTTRRTCSSSGRRTSEGIPRLRQDRLRFEDVVRDLVNELIGGRNSAVLRSNGATLTSRLAKSGSIRSGEEGRADGRLALRREPRSGSIVPGLCPTSPLPPSRFALWRTGRGFVEASPSRSVAGGTGWSRLSFCAASMRSHSLTMLSRSNTDRVLCPVIRCDMESSTPSASSKANSERV